MAFARLRHRLFGCPDVVVYFTLEAGFVSLTVENAGTRPAHDVTVSFDVPWEAIDRLFEPRSTDRTDAADAPICPFETIGFLPAGGTIRTLLGPSDRYFAVDGGDSVASTVTFAARGGEAFENRASHTLDTLGRLRWSIDDRFEDRDRLVSEQR